MQMNAEEYTALETNNRLALNSRIESLSPNSVLQYKVIRMKGRQEIV